MARFAASEPGHAYLQYVPLRLRRGVGQGRRSLRRRGGRGASGRRGRTAGRGDGGHLAEQLERRLIVRVVGIVADGGEKVGQELAGDVRLGRRFIVIGFRQAEQDVGVVGRGGGAVDEARRQRAVQ